MKNTSKGFTLLEVIISLGLILLVVLAVATLAINFTKYQAKRLEKVQVQENFRNTIQIITNELNGIRFTNLLEPSVDKMSFELFFTPDNGTTVVRYHIVSTGRESQVFRKVYSAAGINWLNSWQDTNRAEILGRTPTDNEPVSDRIKALSYLLFTYREGMTIFMVGELVSKAKVSYVSLAYPRN